MNELANSDQELAFLHSATAKVHTTRKLGFDGHAVGFTLHKCRF